MSLIYQDTKKYVERAIQFDNTSVKVWTAQIAIIVWTGYNFEGASKA